jgi:hypothetical protein
VQFDGGFPGLLLHFLFLCLLPLLVVLALDARAEVETFQCGNVVE